MKRSWFKDNWLILCSGVVVGIAALLLTAFDPSNPGNMGFCIACFLRDIAGSLKLQNAANADGAINLSYFRPEIVGLVLGSMLAAIAAKEFKAKAGSSPMTRFVLGVFVMIGALVFLGCPLRLVLRLGGGDLTAVAGLIGFVAGILVGVLCLKKGFTLGRTYAVRTAEGAAFPAGLLLLFVLSLAVPSIFNVSEAAPGAKHAAMALSLVCGLAVGAVAQRSRLCMAGGIRDAVMMKDFHLLSGFLAIWVTVTIGNLLLGKYNLSAVGQAVAHSQYLWSALGMALVGWGAILLGGCPLRQLILAGEGNGDAAVTVVGMLVGAAFAHNFKLAGAAYTVEDGVITKMGGIGTNGKVAVVLGFAVFAVIVLSHLPKKEAK